MQVVRNGFIYLFSNILNKSIPFLLLPIMTKYLSPDEYGILSIYMIMITLYSALIGMNIHMNVSKNFFNVSKVEMAIYIGNILMILLVSFLIYFSITIGISLFYNQIFSVPSKWLLTVPIISVMMMVNNINTTILRNQGRALMFGIFEISNTFLNMCITILFLVSFHYGWYSQAIGIISAYTVFFIIGLVYMFKQGYIHFLIDKVKIKSILNISLPLIPHVLGGVVIAMSDRLFIEKMVGLEAVGIYSVGYTFGMIVMLFSNAFIKAWSPWFFKQLANPTIAIKNRIVKYTYIYIVSIFILTFFISISAKFILPYFISDKFLGAGQYIFWISIGYAFFGVYQIFFPYLVLVNRTYFLAFSTITAAILNLIFNYILIKFYGPIGAAYSTVISFVVSSFLVFWYQSKKYKMPWKITNL